MNIEERAAQLLVSSGVALQVVGNNIGGHNVTYPGDAITSVTRSFTPGDLEAGEFERWFESCQPTPEEPPVPEEKPKPRRRAPRRR